MLRHDADAAADTPSAIRRFDTRTPPPLRLMLVIFRCLMLLATPALLYAASVTLRLGLLRWLIRRRHMRRCR